MAKSCSIDGCNQLPVARGWCTAHYQRWRKHGNPLKITKKGRGRCSVDGCDNWMHGHGWCRRHWMTWRKHGDPLWVRPTFDTCTVDGCSKAPRSRTAELCEMHYARLRRVGALELERWRTDTPSYRAAHSRVSCSNGAARTHCCVDCGEQAGHWSFAWRRVEAEAWQWECVNGTWLAYTGEPSHYEARCFKCARYYDHDFARQGWAVSHQAGG